MSSPNTVLVSIPTGDCWVHKRTAAAMQWLLRDTLGYRVTVIQPSHRPFENNLHHIVRQVLRDGYDYWLTFDADNPPRGRNPLELVDFDLDIVGCPTPVWHWTEDDAGQRPIYWNAYARSETEDGYTEWPTKSGLQKVDAVGTGCLLTARRVWEHPAMQSGAFQRKTNHDGTVDRGNDISFCERATEAGFEIFAHYEYPCSHFVELDLCDVILATEAVHRG